MARVLREVRKQVEGLRLGDVVEVSWHDAYKGQIRIDDESTGSSLLDAPVTSWGVYVGIVGRKSKYLMIIRDHFNLHDIWKSHDFDHSCIPLGMINNVKFLAHALLDDDFVSLLQKELPKATIQRRGRLIIQVQREETV